jgi:hypothetical protein
MILCCCGDQLRMTWNMGSSVLTGIQLQLYKKCINSHKKQKYGNVKSGFYYSIWWKRQNWTS